MNAPDLKELNEKLMLFTYAACLRDIDEACMVLNIPRSVAIAISDIPSQKLLSIARESSILLYPSMLAAETWNKVKEADSEAARAIPVVAHITNG